jgi:hypothetical protein
MVKLDGSGGALLDMLSMACGWVIPAAGAATLASIFSERFQVSDSKLGWLALPAVALTATTLKLGIDIHIMMHPPQFVDLTDHGGKIDREKRPFNDAILHVLLFRWKILGTR